MAETVWEVVGGAAQGGILVREGKDLKSSQAPDRLSTGSLVKELALSHERLQYKLLSGSGPQTGWVSLTLKDKPLLVKSSKAKDKLDVDSGGEIISQSLPSLRPALRELFGAIGQPFRGGHPIEEITIPNGAALRVVTISDIHVDTKVNNSWLGQHLPSRTENDRSHFNVLVLPGDVSDGLERLMETLQMFAEAFDIVCFTPGNHDMWVSRNGSPPDSMAKFRQIVEECDKINVRTRPVRLKSDSCSDVFIVPLLSWYSDTWDREPNLPWYAEEMDQAWMDYRTVKWPEALIDEVKKREGSMRFSAKEGTSQSISEIFAGMNEPWLQEITTEAGGNNSSKPVVISFSHYLPRQELFPPKRFLVNPQLHKVSGSIPLEAQIRRLQPAVHVFGHTHLTVDCVVEGQRYVQWALGSPSEQKAMSLAVAQTGMLVLYDASGEEPHVAPAQVTFWGRFFEGQPRNVSETCPAPFIRKLFSTRYPDITMPYDEEHFLSTPNPGAPIMNYDGLFDPRWRM